MKQFLFICLTSALVLSGCGSLSIKEREKVFMAENNAYIGKTHDELIKGKGVPTGTATLSDGSKVVEYYNVLVEISGGGTFTFPTSAYIRNANGSNTWVYVEHEHALPVRAWNKVCKIDFMVTAKDIVESWKYDGKGCY
jgi:hypothetical protein